MGWRSLPSNYQNAKGCYVLMLTFIKVKWNFGFHAGTQVIIIGKHVSSGTLELRNLIQVDYCLCQNSNEFMKYLILSHNNAVKFMVESTIHIIMWE